MTNPSENKTKARDNIWLTSKTRMHAERRFKKYNLISHMLLSYYALLLITLSIFSDTIATSIPISKINLALSAAIFGASLVVHGFKFGETAQLHRECYLRLQRLISLEDDEQKLNEKYHEIIVGYPNHSARDFDDLIFERVFIKKEPLHNAEGAIQMTSWMLVDKGLRWLMFWLPVLGLILLPSFLIFSPF